MILVDANLLVYAHVASSADHDAAHSWLDSALLLEKTAAHGNLIPDAHLAALAMEHGLTLCSADGDFARFPELRWMNPLSTRSSS